MACEHVIISGRVQGVGFRYWVAREAEARQLTGWVRNLADGRVEAVVCGDRNAVADMLAAVQIGPGLARVDELSRLESSNENFSGFEIRATR